MALLGILSNDVDVVTDGYWRSYATVMARFDVISSNYRCPLSGAKFLNWHVRVVGWFLIPRGILPVKQAVFPSKRRRQVYLALAARSTRVLHAFYSQETASLITVQNYPLKVRHNLNTHSISEYYLCKR